MGHQDKHNPCFHCLDLLIKVIKQDPAVITYRAAKASYCETLKRLMCRVLWQAISNIALFCIKEPAKKNLIENVFVCEVNSGIAVTEK